MKQQIKINICFLLVLWLINLPIQAQSFSVNQTPFSSSVNDEFAPMYFKNGVVFSSNSLSQSSIKSEGGKLYNIVYVAEKDSGRYKDPELFSKELTTILNEGPVSFTPDEKTIFYARNNLVEGKFKDINRPSNTMGVFVARHNNGIWDSITALPFNSEEYSVGTPAWSEAQQRLYFASDMPGGFGGTDLYYSVLKNGKWGRPVNLGNKVNTTGNESYPFISASGLLIFSSDGLGGFGGKDIFYTTEKDKVWQKPIHLDRDINSESDDFGLITDINFKEGFFSSNRKHSQSIFSFSSIVPQFGYCDTLKPINQCFEFFDERFTDTLHLSYEWNFGKGVLKNGYKVEHCFDRAGDYEVVLTIKHTIADSVFEKKAVHRFSIEVNDQFALHHKRAVVAGDPIEVKTSLEAYKNFNIEDVYWNFGYGYNKGYESVRDSISQPGNNYISIGVVGGKNSYGLESRECASSPVVVMKDYQELAAYYRKRADSLSNFSLMNRYVLENTKNSHSYGIYCSVLSEELSALKIDKIEKYINRPNWRIELDADNIPPSSREYLEDLAKFFVKQDNIRMLVAVHAGTKGSSKSNLEKTQQIADNIRQILISSGIDVNLLYSVGYGDTRPYVKSKEKSANAMNQRIEFIVLDE